MAAAAADQSNWDERIARARRLAQARPVAADLLNFYAVLAEFQGSLASEVDRERDDPSQVVGIEHIVSSIQAFLSWLRHRAPHSPELVDDVSDIDRDRWRDLVRSYLMAEGSGARHREPGQHIFDEHVNVDDEAWRSSAASTELGRLVTFVLEAVLQPFAGRLPMQPALQFHSLSPMRCPRCAALPVAAVLREEGHGARRSLLCALCLNEWDCPRIVCPACGEREFAKLPVYTAEQFPHVRIDACDRCRHYLKTIDLSKDGTAVPYVDDIATVSLDLWAREHGYVRVKRNVLGL